MVAAHHGKRTLGFRKLPMLNVLNPGSVYPHRYFMLAFASHRARVTSNALPVVNNETVIADTLSVYNRTKI